MRHNNPLHEIRVKAALHPVGIASPPAVNVVKYGGVNRRRISDGLSKGWGKAEEAEEQNGCKGPHSASSNLSDCVELKVPLN
jgi:hypothetical protein